MCSELCWSGHAHDIANWIGTVIVTGLLVLLLTTKLGDNVLGSVLLSVRPSILLLPLSFCQVQQKTITLMFRARSKYHYQSLDFVNVSVITVVDWFLMLIAIFDIYSDWNALLQSRSMGAYIIKILKDKREMQYPTFVKTSLANKTDKNKVLMVSDRVQILRLAPVL